MYVQVGISHDGLPHSNAKAIAKLRILALGFVDMIGKQPRHPVRRPRPSEV